MVKRLLLKSYFSEISWKAKEVFCEERDVSSRWCLLKKNHILHKQVYFIALCDQGTVDTLSIGDIVINSQFLCWSSVLSMQK